MNFKNNVLLIGSIPPPIGGITIHIERFLENCNNNPSIKIVLFDYKKIQFFNSDKTKLTLWKGIVFFFTAHIVHIHLSTSIKKIIAFGCKFLFFKKVVYTHHNSIINNLKLHQRLFKIVNKVILVNSEKINSLLLTEYKDKIVEIPAFIPPLSVTQLPEFWKNKIHPNCKIIACNAYAFSKINGKDVYGMDIVLKAIEKLNSEESYQIQLIFVDPQNQYFEFVNQNRKEINLLHINEMVDFNSVIQISDLILRPTRTDGDSITVREAIYFQKPIIASNCVKRPEGTILFESENSNDLACKINDVLHNRTALVNEFTPINFVEEIFKVYSSLKNQ